MLRPFGAKAALVINPSFLRMQESRELHTAMDSRIRGNDGDGFVTKAAKAEQNPNRHACLKNMNFHHPTCYLLI
jgi:hypothetical protein